MGKAYRIPGAKERLRKHSFDISRLEALRRLKDTPPSTLATQSSGSSPSGSTGGGTGNFLPLSGGQMVGPIGFFPKLVPIISKRANLDPSSETPKNSSYIILTSADTDLDFIDGAQYSGQFLIMQGQAGFTITIRNAVLKFIVNIVGDGFSNTITVTIDDTSELTTGDKVNIDGTDNFDINNTTITVTGGTTFTYDLGSIGSAVAEAGGLVQRGNILTPDGNDLILDGTNTSTSTIPVVELIFDLVQNSWRVISSSVSNGDGGPFLPTAGGTMLGPIGYDPDLVFVDSDGRVAITSSYMQSTGIGSPDDVFFFDGALFNGQQLEYQVANQTTQIIKNAVLKNITNIVGDGATQIITVTIDDTSLLTTGDKVNIGGTTNFNINDATITVTGGTTFTYDLGSIGSATAEFSGVVQRGNIVMPDDADLTLDSTISTLGVAIGNFVFDPTILGTGWRLISSTVSGGSIAFPIRPPVTTGLPTTGNVVLNLNQTSGHYFTIGPLTGNIDITITNAPAENIAQAFRINITQDGTGGHTVTFNDTLLVQPLINEGIDGVTLLAGDIYDGSIFNIFTMTSTAGSGGGGDVSQWATFPAVTDVNFSTFDGINIDRLLFDQAAGESLASTDIGITSDASGNFLTNAVGEYQWSVDANVKMKLNASQLTMSANIDMDNKSLFDVITVDFKTSNTFDPTALTIIGFDSFSSGLKYNSGATTTNHQFEIGGEPMILISRLGASRGALTTERLIADELIDLTTFTNSSPTNGNIWLDLTSGLFQFQQNGVTIGLGGGGGSGDVIGPGVATENAIARYGDATGKLIADSDIIINPAGEMSAINKLSQEGSPPTSGFLNMLNSQGVVWLGAGGNPDGTLTYSASGFFTFSGDSGSSVIGSNGQSLGTTAFRWGTLNAVAVDLTGSLQVVGNTSLQGNTFLGTGATDEIAVSGRWVSSLIPLSDNLRDLGASGVEWRDLFIDGTADIDRLENNGSNIAIGDTLDFDIGDTIDFNLGQNTVGAAGPADILPNRPNVYLLIKQNGVDLVIPAFAIS